MTQEQAGRKETALPEQSAEPVLTVDEIVAEMNREWAMVVVGAGAMIARERPNAPTHEPLQMLMVGAFRTYMANQTCLLEGYVRNDDKFVLAPRHVKKARIWFESPKRRTYDGFEFFPDPRNEGGNPSYLNLWRGFSKTPDYSNRGERWKKYATFQEHLENNICGGNKSHCEWLFAWFAWILQRPRDRVGTSVVLRGDQGTGKTIVGEVIGSLLGPHYKLVDDSRYLVGQFNAHLGACLLLQVDEGFWAGDKAAEGRLKGMITSKKQMIEAKGVDPIQVDNRVNVMFSSNEAWVVPAGMGERRHAVFDVSSDRKEDHRYFRKLLDELDAGGYEALLADLLEYDLDSPRAANPRVIPKTRGLLEQKIRSFDALTQWWFERLINGAQVQGESAWQPYVPTGVLFEDYLRSAEQQGVRRRAAETTFGIDIKKLVPGLGVRKFTQNIERVDAAGRSFTKRGQVRGYVFPSLQECRTAFEEKMNQPIDWDDTLEPDADANAADEDDMAGHF